MPRANSLTVTYSTQELRIDSFLAGFIFCNHFWVPFFKALTSIFLRHKLNNRIKRQKRLAHVSDLFGKGHASQAGQPL